MLQNSLFKCYMPRSVFANPHRDNAAFVSSSYTINVYNINARFLSFEIIVYIS